MGKGPGKSSLKPGFHTCMIAVITAIARKKGSAIVAIILKPLSSYRSDHSHRSDNDHWDVWDRESSFSAIMVITVIIGKPLSSDHSNCSDRKKTSTQCVRSPVSGWLPPWEPRNHWICYFLWRRCKNTTALTTNFQQNIETSTRKTIAAKQLGKIRPESWSGREKS